MQVDVFIDGFFPGIIIMIVNYCFPVFGAAIANLTLFLLMVLWKQWFLGKCLSSRLKKYLSILGNTFLSKGRLNQIIFTLWLRLLWVSNQYLSLHKQTLPKNGTFENWTDYLLVMHKVYFKSKIWIVVVLVWDCDSANKSLQVLYMTKF